jgi:hypothetical protein
MSNNKFKIYSDAVFEAKRELDGINLQLNQLAFRIVELFPLEVGAIVYRKGYNMRYEIVSIDPTFCCPFRPDVKIRRFQSLNKQVITFMGEISTDRRNWIQVG